MTQPMHPHRIKLNEYCLQNLKILHAWYGRFSSHFVALGDGHLYFYRVWGMKGPYQVSQDARIPVYDHTDPRQHDGLELFYLDPQFRALSNTG
jgi:hypothetical protein